jgi:nicotinate-nucleotide adenylyltransferase
VSRSFEVPLWQDVIALFGGTFDPPHLGHREAVKGLFAEPGVKRVLVLPSPNPPHKPSFTPLEHRLEMTRLNFCPTTGDSSYPAEVEIDLREITRSASAPGKSYTYDTLQDLRRDIPDLAFVIGSDQLRDLERWHRFPEILELCHWIVLERNPDGGPLANKLVQSWLSTGVLHALPGSSDMRTWRIRQGHTCLRLATTQAPSISSTEIRQKISLSGTLPQDGLLPEVLDYLKRNNVYGTHGGTG